MKLTIPRHGLGNIKVFFNRFGYHQQVDQRTLQTSFAKRLGRAAYPRFHIYFTETDETVQLNIHLDAKQPSYQGVAAHSGEYGGPLVATEVERIKKFLRQET